MGERGPAGGLRFFSTRLSNSATRARTCCATPAKARGLLPVERRRSRSCSSAGGELQGPGTAAPRALQGALPAGLGRSPKPCLLASALPTLPGLGLDRTRMVSVESWLVPSSGPDAGAGAGVASAGAGAGGASAGAGSGGAFVGAGAGGVSAGAKRNPRRGPVGPWRRAAAACSRSSARRCSSSRMLAIALTIPGEGNGPEASAGCGSPRAGSSVPAGIGSRASASPGAGSEWSERSSSLGSSLRGCARRPSVGRPAVSCSPEEIPDSCADDGAITC
jgi:hypothetical protein